MSAPRPLAYSLSRFTSAASMLAALALANTHHAQAQSPVVWQGTGAGSDGVLWTTPGNWAGGVLPQSTDSVRFGTGPASTVILNGNQAVTDITFDKSYTLGVYGTSNVLASDSGVITVLPTLTATLNAVYSGSFFGLSVSGGGTLYLTNPNNLLGTGTITVDGAGTTLMADLGGLSPQVNGTGGVQPVGRQNGPVLGLSTATRTLNLQNGGEFKLIGSGANPDGGTVAINLSGEAGAINVTSAFQQMVIDDTNQIGGFGNLVKNGKGRLTLASQDYNLGGNVTINGGILDLNRLQGAGAAGTRFSSLSGTSNGSANTITINSGGALMLNAAGGVLDVATVIANDGAILANQGGDNEYGLRAGGNTLEINGTVNLLTRDLFAVQTQRFVRMHSDLTGTGTLQIFGSTNAGGTPRVVLQRSSETSTFSGIFRLMENVSLEANPRQASPVDTGKLLANGDIDFAGWGGQLDVRDSDSAAANVKNYTANDISVTTTQAGSVNRITVGRATTAAGTGHQFNFGSLGLGDHRLAIEGNNGYSVGFSKTVSVRGDSKVELRTAPLILNNAAAVAEDAAGRTLTLIKTGVGNTGAQDVTSAGVISVSNLQVASGTLHLRGASGAIGSGFGGAPTTITINGGGAASATNGLPTFGTLNLDNNGTVLGVTAANNNDRVADNAVINMRSNSVLRLTSVSPAVNNVQTTETIGTVNVSGHGLIDVAKSGTAPAPVALTINSLNLTGTKPTVNFTGGSLGAAGTNASRIIIGNQAANSSFLGAQYHTGNEWAKYDTTVDNGVAIGVTPFVAADYAVNTFEDSWDATQHVKQTSGFAFLAANRSVRTINLQPTSTHTFDTAGFTLNVAGGGIITSGSTAGFVGVNGVGGLTSSSGDLYVHNNSTLDIKVPVTNFLGADGVVGGGDDVSVNFIKSGTGTLRLTHQSLGIGTGATGIAPFVDAAWSSTLTGSWIVNDGVLDVHRGQFLGGRPIVMNGGHLNINEPVAPGDANSILSNWNNNVTVNGNAFIGTDDNGESNDPSVGGNTIVKLGSLTVNNGSTLGLGNYNGDIAFMGGATFNGKATINIAASRGNSTNNSHIINGAITGDGFDVVTYGANVNALVIGGGPGDTANNTFTSPMAVYGGTVRLNKANGTNAISDTAAAEDLVINGGTVVWGPGHHGDLSTTNDVNLTNNGVVGLTPNSPAAALLSGQNQIPDTAAVTLLAGTLGENDRITNEKWGTLVQKNGTLNAGLGTMEVGVMTVTGGAFGMNPGGTFKAGTMNLQVGAYSPTVVIGLPGDPSRMSTLEVGSGGLNMTGQNIVVGGGSSGAIAGAGAILKLGGNVTAVDDPMLGNSGNQGIFIQIGNSFRELGNSRTDLMGANRTFTIDEDVQFYVTTPVTNGGIIKEGGGALVLQPHQASNFSGPIIVNSGLLAARADKAFGTSGGGVTVGNGGTVQLEGGWTYDDNFTLSGPGALVPGTTTARELGALVSETGKNRIQGTVTLAGDATIASNGTINPSATPAGASYQFWPSELVLQNANGLTGTGTVTLSGNGNGTITGGVNTTAGGLVKEGGGLWTISGASSFSGATLISAGRLQVTNAAALGATSAGTTVYAGASLELAGGISLAEPLTLNGSGVDGLAGGLTSVAGNNSYTGGITLGSDSVISSLRGNLSVSGNIAASPGNNRNLTLTGRGNGSVSGGIGIGSNTLTKNGSGTWTLSGTNTSTGATTIRGGNLMLDHGADNGSKISSSAPLTLAGGNLLVQGNTAANTTVTVGGLVRSTGGGVVQVTSGATSTATVNLGDISQPPADPITTLPVTGGSLEFVLPQNGAITTTTPVTNGILGGYATIGQDWATKSGSNIVPFAAYVPFDATGLTGLTANSRLNGSLKLPAFSALTTNSLKLESGRGLSMDGSTLTLSSGGLLYNGSGSATGFITGATGSVTAATPEDELFIHTAGGVLDVGTQLIGFGGGSLTKSGPGTLILRNTGSAFTGTVNVNGGTVTINGLGSSHPTALGAHTGNRNININNATFRLLGGYDLNLNGGQQMQLVIGSSGATIETLYGGGSDTNGTLTINDAGQLSGSGDILFKGGSRLTIGQASTGFANYTGNVTVDGGVLNLINFSSVGGRAEQTITLKAGSSLINQVASGSGVTGLPNNLVLEGGASLFVSGGNRAYTGDVQLSGTNSIMLVERDNVAQQRDLHLMGRVSGQGIALNVVGGSNANPFYLSNSSNDFTGAINLGTNAALEVRQMGSLGQNVGGVTVNLAGANSRLLLRNWQNADYLANVVVSNTAEINSDRVVNYGGGSGQLLSINNLTVNGGDILQFGGGNSYVTHVTGTATFAADPVLNVTGNVLFENGINFTGTADTLDKRGGGSIILRGAANHTGTTLIQGGLVDLRGANGALANSSRIELRGGELRVENAEAANTTRLNASGQLVLGGGTLRLNGDQTLPANASVAAGNTTIVFNPSSETATSAISLGTVANPFTRAVGATVQLQAAENGGAAVGSLNRGNVRTSPRVLVPGLADTGTEAVVPGIFGNNGLDFVQYDGTTLDGGQPLGLRDMRNAGSINSPTYRENEAETGWTDLDIARTTAARTLTDNRALQALKVEGAVTVNLSAFNLRVETGGILAVNNAVTISSDPTGTLTAGPMLPGTGPAELFLGGNNTLTVSANIANNGTQPVAVVKTGTGTVILSGAGSSFTGGIFHNSGTLTVNAGSALGGTDTVRNTITLSGGTLNMFTASVDSGVVLPKFGQDINVTSNGSTIILDNGTLATGTPGTNNTYAMGKLTIAGAYTLGVSGFDAMDMSFNGAMLTGDPTIDLPQISGRSNTSVVTIGGDLSGTGFKVSSTGNTASVAAALNIGSTTATESDTTPNTYAGKLVLVNTFPGQQNQPLVQLNKAAGTTAITGDVEINAGQLNWLQADQMADSGRITLNFGTVDFAGKNETMAGVTMRGGAFRTNSANVTPSNTVSVTGDFDAVGATNTLTADGIQVNSNSTLAINGILKLNGFSKALLGASQARLELGGLEMTGTLLTQSSGSGANFVVLNGDVTTFPSELSANLGNSTDSDTFLDLNGSRTFTVADGPASVDLSVSTVVRNLSGAEGAIVKNGPGRMQIQGGGTANNYTGPTTINEGEVVLFKNAGVNALGSGNITVGDGNGGPNADKLILRNSNQINDLAALSVSASGLLDLSTFNTSEQISVLNGSGSVNLGPNSTLTISGFLNSLFSGSIEGGGGLVKSGDSTLDLSGSNNYLGQTEILGGVLNVKGSVGGITTYAGSTLAPGAGPGSLNARGDFDLQAGAALRIELGGTTPGAEYDRINVTGGITLAGDLQGSLINGFTPTGDLFFIMINDGADAVNGIFNGLPEGSFVNFSGSPFQITYLANFEAPGGPSFVGGNDIALVVPEPATGVSLLMGLGSLLGVRRFRRRGA